MTDTRDRATPTKAHLVRVDAALRDPDVVLGPIVAGRVPTGFDPLDEVTGGFAPGSLVLLSGRPGVGKTALGLQWARAAAASGLNAAFVSYEHDARTLLARLVVAETAALLEAGHRRDEVLLAALRDHVSSHPPLGPEPLPDDVDAARASLEADGDRLFVVDDSTVSLVGDAFVHHLPPGIDLLVVDYLQRLPIGPADHGLAAARMLKQLALEEDAVVLAVSSLDAQGISKPRPGLEHLAGAEVVAYEADVVCELDDKLRVVSPVHHAFDPTLVGRFRNESVLEIVKNRHGAAGLAMEFDRDLANWRFRPSGRFVAERLRDPGGSGNS